jgi:hypothetical protein
MANAPVTTAAQRLAHYEKQGRLALCYNEDQGVSFVHWGRCYHAMADLILARTGHDPRPTCPDPVL